MRYWLPAATLVVVSMPLSADVVAAARSSRSPVGEARLLVVEDDDSIGVPLVEGLEMEGFTVSRVRTGAEALTASDSASFVLLDLGLPDLDGGEVCRRLRASTEVPIIVVTAREDELDRVRLLEIGADDYVVKPFGFRELVARIRAVQRRVGTARDGAATGAADRAARGRSGCPAGVAARRGGRADARRSSTCSRSWPSDRGSPGPARTSSPTVWDEHWWGPTKTLDVHVASLRRKLAGVDVDHDPARRRLPVRSARVRPWPAACWSRT